MRIALLIPPGFTQYNIAENLSEKYNIPIISIKNLLLQEVNSGSVLGLDIKKQVDNSKPVSDDNIINLVGHYFEENPHNEGFLLDGIPCNNNQALALDKILAKNNHKLQGLVFLNLNYDKLMELQTGRLVCRACNANFNIYSKPPYMEKICDDCGSRLYQRSDDREETISRRIRDFEIYLELLKIVYDEKMLKIVISNIDADEILKLSEDAFNTLNKNDDKSLTVETKVKKRLAVTK